MRDVNFSGNIVPLLSMKIFPSVIFKLLARLNLHESFLHVLLESATALWIYDADANHPVSRAESK